MWGAKGREIARLQRLANARAEQINTQRIYINTLTRNQNKFLRDLGSVMDVVAAHLTLRGTPDQLQAALEKAGHGAELRYALLDHPTNDQPEVTA